MKLVCHPKTIQVQFELAYIILDNFLARVTCLFLTGFSHEDFPFWIWTRSVRGDNNVREGTNYIVYLVLGS